MEGLRWPIRYVEIGNELSSYQPEPVDEYLETLTHAYEAAHAASEDVLIGHAAFLFAPVNMDVTDLSQVDSVWAGTRRVDDHHDLADMRAILDRPDAFDFINIHNLGPPYEIEHVMRWLRHETASRGYEKPVVISDTTPTSYIGWGPATECTGPVLGVLGAPATEADRCRLAGFFTRLVQNDRATLDWTRGFVAADHVQRLIIAAEQGVRIINLAFVTDLPWLTLEPMRAGAGISAWGGAIRINPWTGRVLDYYPPFYAVRQMMDHLAGYAAIEHLRMEDERIRVYRVDGAAGPFWVAWLDPERAIIAGDDPPMIEVAIDIGAAGADIEPVITAVGQTDPTRTRVRAPGGSATVTLSHAPIYIFPTPPG
jgi:hypothetical protein